MAPRISNFSLDSRTAMDLNSGFRADLRMSHNYAIVCERGVGGCGAKHRREKVIDSLRRSWEKRAADGQARAQAAPVSEKGASVGTEALGGGGSEK